MTPEEYNLYKFYLDVAIPLITLLVGVFSGVYVENRWKIVNKIKLIIKKENKNSTKVKGNGPVSTTTEGDPTSFSINAKDDARVDVTIGVGTSRDGLKQVIETNVIHQLTEDSEFICTEFAMYFKKNEKVFTFLDDYMRAEKYKQNKKIKSSATIYTSLLN